ncbi:hypothetical protein INR49_002029 [Caranx melampygus]|nr:hypothetical protein INR49_002029 [Caranx melampygus]
MHISKGKSCQPDMSLTQRHQMKLDTLSATLAGMDGQTRSSHKYLLLQVWCGLLTVAMVVMAVFLTSIKPKPTQDGVPIPKPDSVTPTINTARASFKSADDSSGSSLSYIQLDKSATGSWEVSHGVQFSILFLRNDSIHFTKTGLYFIYAQVTFTKHESKSHMKSVILIRNEREGKQMKTLAEGTFPSTCESSVWVAKIVKLSGGDSVSLNVTDQVLVQNTFWGAYQIH